MNASPASVTPEIAAQFIRERVKGRDAAIGIILGSGMGMLADEVQQAVRIPYSEIPGFPVPTVQGHEGKLVVGELAGKAVVVMQGRFHYYEGHSMSTLAFPVRVMKLLGVQTLIVTNAAGGVNPAFRQGDFMLIRDHLNFVFNNPLIGPNEEIFGPRFPDTSRIYSPQLMAKASGVAARMGIPLHTGVYLFNTGPAYETPAEVQVAAKVGADAVGMSTFPEALAATHCGIQVLGVSYISNLAAGIGGGKLSHQEVIETTGTIREKFIQLIQSIVGEL